MASKGDSSVLHGRAGGFNTCPATRLLTWPRSEQSPRRKLLRAYGCSPSCGANVSSLGVPCQDALAKYAFSSRVIARVARADQLAEPVGLSRGLSLRTDLHLNPLLSVAVAHNVGRNRFLHGGVQALGGRQRIIEGDFLARPNEVR